MASKGAAIAMDQLHNGTNFSGGTCHLNFLDSHLTKDRAQFFKYGFPLVLFLKVMLDPMKDIVNTNVEGYLIKYACKENTAISSWVVC